MDQLDGPNILLEDNEGRYTEDGEGDGKGDGGVRRGGGSIVCKHKGAFIPILSTYPILSMPLLLLLLSLPVRVICLAWRVFLRFVSIGQRLDFQSQILLSSGSGSAQLRYSHPPEVLVLGCRCRGDAVELLGQGATRR